MEGIENLSIMNFEISEIQKELLKVVDDACKELRQYEDKCYLERKRNDMVKEIFKKAGLLGVPISNKYGGFGADLLTYCLMLERIGQEGCGVRTFFSGHISIGQMVIQEWGTEEQKQKYLPKTTEGDLTMAFALTEPDAGSDPSSLKTTFEEKNDNYVLNGNKAWISNGTIADVITTYAYPKDKVGEKKDLCAFIVEKSFPGYSVAEEKHKSGLVTSDTGMIYFDNCIVPKENLLGPYGKGMNVALSAIMNGRLSVAAGCVGVIEDCLKEAAEYAKLRVQHGEPIACKQLVQRHIGIIAAHLEAAKLLVHYAAVEKMKYDENKDIKLREKANATIAKTKYLVTHYSFDAANRTMQIFGANGCSLENRPARHFNDTRITQIYEGTNEILEQIIALSILGKEYKSF